MGVLHPELRRDLDIYDSAERTLIREPTSAAMMELNPLQYEIARRFDGKHAPAEIAAEIAAEYEIELPDGFVQSFEAVLGQKGLLMEVRIESPAAQRTAARAALRLLRRQGLSDPPTEQPDARAAIAIGLGLLARGEVISATSYFALAEEADPAARALRAYRDVTVAETARATLASVFPFPRKVLPNSDRIVELVHRAARILFTRPLLVVQLFLVVSGFFLLPFVDTQTVPFIPTNPIDWMMALAVISPLFFLHELGHAVTCRHFGGRVREIGVMLMMGIIPAAFADVTSSQAFPERRHRLLVVLGGLFVTMEIGGLAGWYVLLGPHGGFTHDVALRVFRSNLYVVLLNLVPFIPLDGYYALSEIIGVENLRARALETHSTPNLLKRGWPFWVVGLATTAEFVLILPVVLTVGLGWLVMPLTVALVLVALVQILRRARKQADPEAERRRVDGILFWFWLGARAWFAFYIVGVTIKLYTCFVGQWRGAGLILFCLMFGVRLLAPLWRRRPRTGPKPALHHRPWPLRLATIGACVVLYALIPLPRRSVVDGQVAPQEGGAARATTEGLIDRIEVRTGDAVRAGQVVAVVKNPELTAALARGRASLEERQALVALARAGLSPEERQALDAAVRARAAELAAARQRQAGLEGLAGLERQDVLQQAQEARQAAGTNLGEALGIRGARTEVDLDAVARAEAEARRMEVDLEATTKRAEGLVVRAPATGVVVTPDLDVLRGAAVREGDTILEVFRPDHLRVELYVPLDEAAADIRPGMRVQARLHATPDVLLHGKLESLEGRLRTIGAQSVLVGRAVLRGARGAPRAGARLTGFLELPPMALLHQMALPVLSYFRIDFWQFW